MGANLAKNSASSGSKRYNNPYAKRSINPIFDKQDSEVKSPRTPISSGNDQLMVSSNKAEVAAPEKKMERKQMKDEGEEAIQETDASSSSSSIVNGGYGSSDDEFYDGIPRFKRKPLSLKPRSRRHKVSDLLGRAGSAGLGKAAGVIESLGSTVNGSKFVSGATVRSNELSILSFEVANTIVKGSNIMMSLSQRSITTLKEVVFPSQGVQQLVSTNLDEFLNIVAVDKREELKIFAGEIVRFGNRCKDSQWHNLDRFFEKQSRGGNRQKQSPEEAEAVMQQLMVLVQQTALLYQELHSLAKLEQDYQQLKIARFRLTGTLRGNSLASLEGEIKAQKKFVRNLKKKSLWSRSMEEVMEKLVDIALFLNQEITVAFEITEDFHVAEEKHLGNHTRLGPAGLSLHYANIILLIDSIVARPSSLPALARDTLYQSLPPHMKSSLRSKLQSFHVKQELSITEIKAEMEKTLHWLAPVAINTAKAHHGFGWVGEWGNTGSDSNRQNVAPLSDYIQVEALDHAIKSKTEAYILELLLWLNHLVNRTTKSRTNHTKPKNGSIIKENVPRRTPNSPTRSITEEQQTTQQASGMNLSQEFESMLSSSDEVEILSKKLDIIDRVDRNTNTDMDT